MNFYVVPKKSYVIASTIIPYCTFIRVCRVCIKGEPILYLQPVLLWKISFHKIKKNIPSMKNCPVVWKPIYTIVLKVLPNLLRLFKPLITKILMRSCKNLHSLKSMIVYFLFKSIWKCFIKNFFEVGNWNTSTCNEI